MSSARSVSAQIQTPAVTMPSTQITVTDRTSASFGRCGSRVSQECDRDNRISSAQKATPATRIDSSMRTVPIAIWMNIAPR